MKILKMQGAGGVLAWSCRGCGKSQNCMLAAAKQAMRTIFYIKFSTIFYP